MVATGRSAASVNGALAVASRLAEQLARTTSENCRLEAELASEKAKCVRLEAQGAADREELRRIHVARGLDLVKQCTRLSCDVGVQAAPPTSTSPFCLEEDSERDKAEQLARLSAEVESLGSALERALSDVRVTAERADRADRVHKAVTSQLRQALQGAQDDRRPDVEEASAAAEPAHADHSQESAAAPRGAPAAAAAPRCASAADLGRDQGVPCVSVSHTSASAAPAPSALLPSGGGGGAGGATTFCAAGLERGLAEGKEKVSSLVCGVLAKALPKGCDALAGSDRPSSTPTPSALCSSPPVGWLERTLSSGSSSSSSSSSGTSGGSSTHVGPGAGAWAWYARHVRNGSGRRSSSGSSSMEAICSEGGSFRSLETGSAAGVDFE